MKMFRFVSRRSLERSVVSAAFFRSVLCVAFCALVIFPALSGCVTQGVMSAEEYFSLGMAFFDLGQAAKDASTRTKHFTEAEKWLNRARQIDKTKNASEYNLGRIAFETGRFEEAAERFESILKRDSANTLALKAAAYSRIKTGEIEKAEAWYQQLLELIPESADDGYNYALVLYTVEKYAEAERVLDGYKFALLNNNDTLLLYARAQKAQGKVEAADSYAQWLVSNKNSKVRIEYAQILESQEFYARALEEYRAALTELETDKAADKLTTRFDIARLLLIADSETDGGIKELSEAVDAGFSDIEAVEKLLEDKRISGENLQSLRTLINDMQRKKEEKEKAEEAAKAAAEADAAAGIDGAAGTADPATASEADGNTAAPVDGGASGSEENIQGGANSSGE